MRIKSAMIHAQVSQAAVAAPDFPYLIAVNADGFYCVPKAYRKREVARRLLNNQVNEPRTLELIKQFTGKGDIVSGGAFVGDFLPVLSRTLRRGARLHAFEPNPLSFAATAMTIALNDLKNVLLSPVAVGRERAVMPLQVTGQAGKVMGGTSRIVESACEGQTIDVNMVRIDDLVPEGRTVSVLHLDIEGHEGLAVQGAARTIAKGHPVIVLETLAAQDPLEREAMLRALCPAAGYRFMGMMERNAFYKATHAIG